MSLFSVMSETKINGSSKIITGGVGIVLLVVGVILVFIGLSLKLTLHYTFGFIVSEVAGLALLMIGLLLTHISSSKEEIRNMRRKKEKSERSDKVSLSGYQVVGAILLLSGLGIFFLYFWLYLQNYFYEINIIFYAGCILMLIGVLVLICGRIVVGLVRTWRNLAYR
jgi:hypothetical protein